MPNLTCYRISDSIRGKEVRSFADVIDPDKDVDTFGPVEGDNFSAELFVATGPPREPSWAAFLREGFEDLMLPRFHSSSAVLVLNIAEPESAFFALTFGYGRYLLRDGAFQRNFGLRCAINMMYPTTDQEIDTSRIKAVDTKRVGPNTLRLRGQASRATTLETFDFDNARDFLRRVVGQPVDADAWGNRVTGADSVGITSDTSFSNTGQLCAQLLDLHARTDYQERFGWIDHIQWIRDTELLDRLQEAVCHELETQSTDTDLELAVPEIVDWDRLAAFNLPFERRGSPIQRPDLRLRDLLAVLAKNEKLADLAVGRLKQRTIRGIDSAGERIYEWPVWRCLSGTLELDEHTYILDDGDFYEVADDYLADLDAFISDLPEYTEELPVARRGQVEEDYNRAAADQAQYLLMDRKTLSVSSRTTRIEICDLFSHNGAFIHIKRHLGSSTLSHLFAQGFIPADTLVGEPRFCVEVYELIKEVSEDEGFAEQLEPDSYSSRDHEVVYAVIADWGERDLKEALPFFSKVTLRQIVEQLRRVGYPVSFAKVHLET